MTEFLTPPAPDAQRGPSPDWPDAAPTPPRVAPRRRRRAGLLVAAVLSAVVAAVLAITAVHLGSGENTPPATVRSYFAALSKGDAATALAYAVTPPTGQYLTADVLQAQLRIAPLSEVSVGSAVTRGDSATVQVSYRLGFADGPLTQHDTAVLARHGSSWLLTKVGGAVTLSSLIDGSDRVTFLGRPLPSATVQLFPGAVPVTAASSAVTVTGHPAVRLTGSAGADFSVSVSPAAKASLRKALDIAFTRCLTGKDRNPYCPLPEVDRPVPGSLRGTAQTTSDGAEITLADSNHGRIDIDETVSVTGRWSQWNFNNLAVAKTGNLQVTVHAEASTADLNTVYWQAPS